MRTLTDRELRILLARSSVGVHHAPLNLSNANLEMVNLPHADLRGADLAGANLRGAMLWGALLGRARLDGADLTCANLTWCSLLGCSMNGTLLVEADMDEVTADPSLANANTAGADMVTLTCLLAGSVEDLRDVVHQRETPVLSGANLLKEHMQNAPKSLRMRGAMGFATKVEQLRQAQARVLSDDDLRSLCDWSAATGKPLNLRGCNLAGANLRNAVLDGACLAFTDLRGADTRGASRLGAETKDSYGWTG